MREEIKDLQTRLTEAGSQTLGADLAWVRLTRGAPARSGGFVDFESSLEAGMLDSIRSMLPLMFSLTGARLKARYASSFLGGVWALVTPVLLMFGYYFAFGLVLGVRWEGLDLPTGAGALVIFSGLLLHGFLAEIAGGAVQIIKEYSALIKKTVFPSAVLPGVVFLSATVTLAINIVILTLACIVFRIDVGWEALSVVVILINLMIVGIAVAYFVAVLGVYLPDAQHFLSVILMMLLFLAPVFYPVEAVPDQLRSIIELNPLTPFVLGFREAVFFQEWPGFTTLAAPTAIGIVLTILAYLAFAAKRKGFADEL